jgi:hypothetical protein
MIQIEQDVHINQSRTSVRMEDEYVHQRINMIVLCIVLPSKFQFFPSCPSWLSFDGGGGLHIAESDKHLSLAIKKQLQNNY